LTSGWELPECHFLKMETIKDIVLGYLIGIIASIIVTLFYIILKNKNKD
jgi:hypothetical protein